MTQKTEVLKPKTETNVPRKTFTEERENEFRNEFRNNFNQTREKMEKERKKQPSKSYTIKSFQENIIKLNNFGYTTNEENQELQIIANRIKQKYMNEQFK